MFGLSNNGSAHQSCTSLNHSLISPYQPSCPHTLTIPCRCKLFNQREERENPMDTKHRDLNTPASGNSFPIGLILIRMQCVDCHLLSLVVLSASSSVSPRSSIHLSRPHSLPSPEIIVHHRLTLYYVWTCFIVLFSSLSCLLPSSSCWLRETMACAIQIKNVVGVVFEHTQEGMELMQRATRQMEGGKKKKRTESRTGLPTPSFCACLCGGVWYR